jgi:hypothetical protein
MICGIRIMATAALMMASLMCWFRQPTRWSR